MLEKFDKTTRLIIGLALAVLIWVVGVLIGQEQTITILNPEGGLKSILNRAPTIKVSLMLDFGNGQVLVLPSTELIYGQSVFQLLEKINKDESAGLTFSYQSNKETGELTNVSFNGYFSQNGGKEWLIWLNNKLQTLPLNQIKLKAHDIIELKYIKLVN